MSQGIVSVKSWWVNSELRREEIFVSLFFSISFDSFSLSLLKQLRKPPSFLSLSLSDENCSLIDNSFHSIRVKRFPLVQFSFYELHHCPWLVITCFLMGCGRNFYWSQSEEWALPSPQRVGGSDEREKRERERTSWRTTFPFVQIIHIWNGRKKERVVFPFVWWNDYIAQVKRHRIVQEWVCYESKERGNRMREREQDTTFLNLLFISFLLNL